MASSLIIISGGGEFGSCVAVYLHRAGVPVAMVVSPREWYLRRPVCFAEVLNTGEKEIENSRAHLVQPDDLQAWPEADLSTRWQKTVSFIIDDRKIPVWTTEEFRDFGEALEPRALVLAENSELPILRDKQAPPIIALTSFVVEDARWPFYVESRLNYRLGSVSTEFPDRRSRLDFHFFKYPFAEVKTPIGGPFLAIQSIGDRVRMNEPLGTVNGIEIRSPYEGQVWGLAHSGKMLAPKSPISLIFQGKPSDDYLVCGYAPRTVAGSVLRLILEKFR